MNTPTPWAMRERSAPREVRLKRRHWEIGAPNGFGVAIVFGIDDGNAAFIVEAVNAHASLLRQREDLVAALERAKKCIRIWHGRASPEMKQINAALASASEPSHD